MVAQFNDIQDGISMSFRYLFFTLLVTTLTCFPVCVSTESYSNIKRATTLKAWGVPMKISAEIYQSVWKLLVILLFGMLGFAFFFNFYHLQLFITELVKFLPIKRLKQCSVTKNFIQQHKWVYSLQTAI